MQMHVAHIVIAAVWQDTQTSSTNTIHGISADFQVCGAHDLIYCHALSYSIMCRSRAQSFAPLSAFLPFLFHLSIVIAVLIFIFDYVDQRKFSTTSRTLEVQEADGSITRKRHYTPLQSDIVTTISAIGSLTRIIGILWAGDVMWRCAFLFMEQGGVSVSGVKHMFSGFLVPSPKHFGRKRNFACLLIIYIILFSSNFFSTLITGSITWQTSAHTYAEGKIPLGNIFRFGTTSSLEGYNTYIENVSLSRDYAAAIAILLWNNDQNSTSMKRRLDNATFIPRRSKLEKITIPYFSVTSFEWIKDPNNTLTSRQKAIGSSGNYNPFYGGSGRVGFLPDDQWGPNFKDFKPIPRIISETRILAMRTSRRLTPDAACSDDFGSIPSDVGRMFLPDRIPNIYDCMVFAHVTYRAGVAYCQDCEITSAVVSSGVDALQPAPDSLTMAALAFAPYVGVSFTYTGFAMPPAISFPTTEKRSIELMSRAYQSAWIALTTSGLELETTKVTVALDTSQAYVTKWRVYAWAALHLLLLLLGVLFLLLESGCHYPWLQCPPFAALALDTQRLTNQLSADHDPWAGGTLPEGVLTLVDGENTARCLDFRRDAPVVDTTSHSSQFAYTHVAQEEK